MKIDELLQKALRDAFGTNICENLIPELALAAYRKSSSQLNPLP
jgi:hypothetical protein